MHITFWGSSQKLFAPLIQENLQNAGHQVSSEQAQADVIVLSAPTFDEFKLKRIARDALPTSRIVMLSGFKVYRAAAQYDRTETGEPTTAPLTESSALRSAGDLGMVQAESQLQQLSQPWTILRLPQIFGPGWTPVFHKYLSIMETRRPALLLEPGIANWRFTHGYIADVAAAIALAATHPKAERQIYNLGERETLTVAERLHLLARAAGYKGKILVVPERIAPAHLKESSRDYRNDIILDTGRIHRELGFAATTPEKQIWQQTVAWELPRLDSMKTEGLVENLTPEQISAEDEVLRKFGLLSRK